MKIKAVVDMNCSACSYVGPEPDCEICGGEMDYKSVETVTPVYGEALSKSLNLLEDIAKSNCRTSEFTEEINELLNKIKG